MGNPASGVARLLKGLMTQSEETATAETGLQSCISSGILALLDAMLPELRVWRLLISDRTGNKGEAISKVFKKKLDVIDSDVKLC